MQIELYYTSGQNSDANASAGTVAAHINFCSSDIKKQKTRVVALGRNLAVFNHKYISTLRGLSPNKIKPNAWQRLGICGPPQHATKPSYEFADQRGLFVHYSRYVRTYTKHVLVSYMYVRTNARGSRRKSQISTPSRFRRRKSAIFEIEACVK